MTKESYVNILKKLEIAIEKLYLSTNIHLSLQWNIFIEKLFQGCNRCSVITFKFYRAIVDCIGWKHSNELTEKSGTFLENNESGMG